MNDYIGNALQTRGAEVYTLEDGRGKGMRFLFVRNGRGLEAWISLDRAGDVSRLSVAGVNCGYFSPCGYVAPAFYEKPGAGFLKSFTAGFFTTCGLTAVGSPCTDEGEELPLHGTLSHLPSRLLALEETDECLTVRLRVEDACIFAQKLVLDREYVFSYLDNVFTVTDRVRNDGDAASPYMLLYHCNMGYPLLDEETVVKIPNNGVTPRNERAASAIEDALKMEKPQADYEEACFYYDLPKNRPRAGLYQPKADLGLVLSFDAASLPRFTEWKMMGRRDYVLGLEPGNCTPDGRDVLRKNGTLRFLEPGQTGETSLTFSFARGKDEWEKLF